MFDEAVTEEAGRRILAAAPKGSRVILFGSHARGDAGEHRAAEDELAARSLLPVEGITDAGSASIRYVEFNIRRGMRTSGLC